MPRFYVPSECFRQPEFSLPDTAARHVQVLRHQPGETIELFDGNGAVWRARITVMGKKNVDVRLSETVHADTEPPLRITLLQALSAGDRMETTIQKSVELGVAAIQPVVSERSLRLGGERADKKTARWREIAIAACEQCGRTVVPPVLPVLPLQTALEKADTSSLRLLMSPNRAQALNRFGTPAAVTLLVGPEGGLSAAEESLAAQHGFQAAQLGPRILRTETAAPAALAAMQMLWGDFRQPESATE